MWGQLDRGGRAAAGAGVLVLLAVSAGPALGGTRAVRVNGADMAAARAAVLRRSDLPAGDGWKGGPIKKALLARAEQVATVACSGSSSERSNLVPTGAAYSMFTNTGFGFVSGAVVFRSARMASRDWAAMHGARFRACTRRTVFSALGPAAKVVSFARLAFPNVSTSTVAYRLVADVTPSRRMTFDRVLFRHGRTEVELDTFVPYAERTIIVQAEIHLARMLASRLSV